MSLSLVRIREMASHVARQTLAKRTKKKTPCDLGYHKLFDTLGGDKLCALGCGHRDVGGAEDLKQDGLERRALINAAENHNDAELLAWLEETE